MSSINPLGAVPIPQANRPAGTATPAHPQLGQQAIRDLHARSASTGGGPSGPSNHPTGESPADVARLNARLQLIGRDDPAARRRAFAMYLSHRLAKLLQQPTAPEQMDSLAEKVVAQMEDDPELSASIQEAGGLLLKSVA